MKGTALQDKVKKTRGYLRKEFGIKNDKELQDAIQKMPPLNIGIFVNKQ